MARLIKTDRNGTRYYEGMVQCDRCAGRGGAEAWKFTGYTCYKCGGTGEIMAQWKEYTPEYQAKLDAKRAAKAAKAQAEWEAEEAQREAERMEREAREAEERAQQEAAEAARKAISQYIGNVGDKISATVTLEREISIEVPSFGGWGTTTMRIYTFADANGNKLVWKTSAWLSAEEGTTITIKGTIKGHSEYKGEKQTELQRVKAC